MRPIAAIRERFCWAPGSLVLILVAVCNYSAAQPLPFGAAAPPTQIELGAPHLNTVSGTTVARLEQARALVKSGKWDEAIDVFGELAVDKSERVIELHQGRFVNLRTYCNIQLSHLPQEGLAAYRRRADVMAEQWYREGIAQRDELLLRRVVDEAYCSSWGDDALFAL